MIKIKQRYREIIMLCLASSTVCFIHASPVFYPYIASSYFHKNNDLKMEDFYTCFLFLFLGYPVGTYATKFSVNVFGLSDSFLFLGLSYILSALVFLIYGRLYQIFIGFLLAGA